jgi:hypothetical protein
MSPESKDFGQVAITARTVGPERAPQRNRPRMTRRAASQGDGICKAPETRGIKNRKDEKIFGVGAGIGKRRSGMAWKLVAFRQHSVTRERRRDKTRNLKRGASPDCPRTNAGGNWRAGDRGILCGVRPKNPVQVGR